MSKYSLVPRQVFKRKPGFNGPEYVSAFGALPSPIEAYELITKGFSVYDKKENTYSNYFFCKIGIETEEEGLAIIEKLNARG